MGEMMMLPMTVKLERRKVRDGLVKVRMKKGQVAQNGTLNL